MENIDDLMNKIDKGEAVIVNDPAVAAQLANSLRSKGVVVETSGAWTCEDCGIEIATFASGDVVWIDHDCND